MSDADVPAAALALVERIAGAIRAELGAEIDADPGASSPERADPLNRAFRAVARSLLEADGIPGASLPALVSRTLRRAAEHRLALEGWDDGQVRLLLDLEPEGRDDWLAFLILSSREQIELLLGPGPA
jgi:hypothetical protein